MPSGVVDGLKVGGKGRGKEEEGVAGGRRARSEEHTTYLIILFLTVRKAMSTTLSMQE